MQFMSRKSCTAESALKRKHTHTHSHTNMQLNKLREGGWGRGVDKLRACFNMDPIKTGSAPGTFLFLIALCTRNLLVSWNVKLRDLREFRDLRCVFTCALCDVFVAAGARRIAALHDQGIAASSNTFIVPPFFFLSNFFTFV